MHKEHLTDFGTSQASQSEGVIFCLNVTTVTNGKLQRSCLTLTFRQGESFTRDQAQVHNN